MPSNVWDVSLAILFEIEIMRYVEEEFLQWEPKPVHYILYIVLLFIFLHIIITPQAAATTIFFYLHNPNPLMGLYP